jgi:hypothetical protein
MSPYKKREVRPADLVRTPFGSQESASSLADVIGRLTVGQFAAATIGFAGLLAAIATQLS